MWVAAWRRYVGIAWLWAGLIALTPLTAEAGAWLREKGEGFGILSGTFRTAQTTVRDAAVLPQWDGKYYVEYGLMPWLTLGVDAYEAGYTYGHVLLFARLPLSPKDWRLKVAAELGAGQYHDAAAEWNTMTKLALSVGQGFELDWSGPGWWAVDAIFETRQEAFSPNIYKLEGTAGITPWTWGNPMIKLETGHVPGDPLIWSVTPSLRFPGKKIPDKNDRSWVAGIEYRSVAGLTATGLKLETWWQF